MIGRLFSLAHDRSNFPTPLKSRVVVLVGSASSCPPPHQDLSSSTARTSASSPSCRRHVRLRRWVVAKNSVITRAETRVTTMAVRGMAILARKKRRWSTYPPCRCHRLGTPSSAVAVENACIHSSTMSKMIMPRRRR